MTPVTAGSAPAVDVDQLRDELAAVVSREAEGASVPGVSVAIAHGDHDVVVTHGVTNVEHPLPVDGRTLFQIGSTTKTFTATAVMRLVDDGRLGLDDPVRDHLPGFRLADDDHSAAVTVRQLLTHAGGWAGDWFLLSSPDYGREGALARVVEDMWQAPQILPPGEAFSYNNAGFYVVGRLVEVITGELYPEAIRSLVLEPAGLDHTFFHADEMVIHRVAAGHIASDDGPRVQRPWPRPFYAWPAGALCSCADDLLKWARFWFAGGAAEDGTQVLKPETADTMTTPQLEVDSSLSLGLAWMLREAGGKRVVAHGGTTVGYLSVFAMVPEERFAVSIMSNSSGAGGVNRRLERWAFENVLGIDAERGVNDPVGDVDLTAYAGRYGLGPDADWAHTVEVDEDGLVLVGGTPGAGDPPPRFRLAVGSNDEIVVTDPDTSAGVRGNFRRAADGSIAWLRFGLRVYNRLSD